MLNEKTVRRETVFLKTNKGIPSKFIYNNQGIALY